MKIRYSIKAATPRKNGEIPKTGWEWDYNEVVDHGIQYALGRAAKFLNKHYGEGQWVVTDSGQFCHLHSVAGGSTLLYIEEQIVEGDDE